MIATTQRPDGTWDAETTKGTVDADVVINAAGLWARELAIMAGLELPLMTMEHQYLVTEAIPEIAALGRRLPSVADRNGEYYMRQKGQGLLVGIYKKDGRFWSEDGTPLDFGDELLDEGLDRIEENVMPACARVPVLAAAGIRRVINGPMIWAPDSAALFGPVPDLKNYFCCAGIIPGVSQSGGLGLMLAQWIVDGEPQYDMFAWNLARYGDWADKKFATARAHDCYSHRFKIHFPYEERLGRIQRSRAERTEIIATIDGYRFIQRGIPLYAFRPNYHRRDRCGRATGFLHRRSGLGNTLCRSRPISTFLMRSLLRRRVLACAPLACGR